VSILYSYSCYNVPTG